MLARQYFVSIGDKIGNGNARVSPAGMDHAHAEAADVISTAMAGDPVGRCLGRAVV